MKKRIAALTLAVAMAAGLVACGSAPAANNASAAQKYNVGVCQLVQHPALDAATQGFIDVLTEEFGENITIDNQNAAGDAATCATICNTFVSGKVDLILGNATPALLAATSATADIPVLGTAITEYGTALGLENFNGTVGTNVSGTSDLAPLDQQAAMFDELLPDASNIGIIYCSAEPNSVYQANVVKDCLEKAGKTVTIYTFADSNDVATVTKTACDDNDALYIPTDNTAASCAEAINNVAEPANTPIIAGEEGMCSGFGIATLSIDYYELGRTTGVMAAKILKGEAKVAEMPIEYYQNPVKKYVASRCEKYGVVIPEGYEAIEE